MCKRVRCSKCNKYTWSGCGRHIETVLKDVRPEQRCHCGTEKKSNRVIVEKSTRVNTENRVNTEKKSNLVNTEKKSTRVNVEKKSNIVNTEKKINHTHHTDSNVRTGNTSKHTHHKH
jgi:hypothetical protein